MTTDDVLAYLASKPKKHRPSELRSDARMLSVWLRMRNDADFFDDVIVRHRLENVIELDESDPVHEHAISNAWGHCMHVYVTEMVRK